MCPCPCHSPFPNHNIWRQRWSSSCTYPGSKRSRSPPETLHFAYTQHKRHTTTSFMTEPHTNFVCSDLSGNYSSFWTTETTASLWPSNYTFTARVLAHPSFSPHLRSRCTSLFNTGKTARIPTFRCDSNCLSHSHRNPRASIFYFSGPKSQPMPLAAPPPGSAQSFCCFNSRRWG